MVVRSGFEIQLVSADTKIPFKEHEKDGKVYVEAEPDAEYYISIRRVDDTGPQCVVSYYYIDGNFLAYQTNHTRIAFEPAYHGIWSRQNGIHKHVALQFAKPNVAKSGVAYTSGMGKVEAKLFIGQYYGNDVGDDYKTSFEPSQVELANSSTSKKKFLLSKNGDTTITKVHQRETPNYRAGASIGTITLYYCSAVGMMDVGIVPKTDIWAYHRLKRPAPCGQRFDAPCKKIMDPMDSSKFVDLVDLTK